jgi:ribonuclease P protein component
MLPKKRRIERKQFPHILSKGKRFNSPNLLLSVVKTEDNGFQPSKFSFSVSKKVQKKAVDRNKYRRRGYSVVKKYIEIAEPGFLCFFSFKKSLIQPTFDILEKEIGGLLRQAGVLI